MLQYYTTHNFKALQYQNAFEHSNSMEYAHKRTI